MSLFDLGVISCQQVTQEFLNYLYEAKSGSRDQKYQEEEGEEEEVPYISAEDVVRAIMN